MIRYSLNDSVRSDISVSLEGKIVGAIRRLSNGHYQYWPKKGRPGDEFSSLTECKKSLEE